MHKNNHAQFSSTYKHVLHFKMFIYLHSVVNLESFHNFLSVEYCVKFSVNSSIHLHFISGIVHRVQILQHRKQNLSILQHKVATYHSSIVYLEYILCIVRTNYVERQSSFIVEYHFLHSWFRRCWGGNWGEVWGCRSLRHSVADPV